MIDINDLRFSAANSVRDLALLPSEVLELLDRLEAAEKERDWHAERCEDAMNECARLRTAVRHESDCVEAAKTKLKALHAKPAPTAVAYLDLGTGGYMDIGTDLTDEELAAIPKGRHMLGIIGTYGVDGYVPAQPVPSVPDGVAEALQRLIENGAVLGPSSSEDALLVARYRQHLLSSAPSVSTSLLVAIVDLVAQMEIVSRVGFVDTSNDKDSCAAFCVAEGTWLELMSAVESLASALAAAPETKP